MAKKRTKKALNTDFDNNSPHEADIQRSQMTSNELKRRQSISNENSKKSRVKNNLIYMVDVCNRILKLMNTN